MCSIFGGFGEATSHPCDGCGKEIGGYTGYCVDCAERLGGIGITVTGSGAWKLPDPPAWVTTTRIRVSDMDDAELDATIETLETERDERKKKDGT